MLQSKFMTYGLVDPRDMLIHYVGKSSTGMKRPGTHWHRHSNHGADCERWLVVLRDLGIRYDIVVLDVIVDPKAPSSRCWWTAARNPTELCDAERWWIAYGRALGWPLKNMTEGGDGARSLMRGRKYRPKPPVTVETRTRQSSAGKAREQTPAQIAGLERARLAPKTYSDEGRRSIGSAAKERAARTKPARSQAAKLQAFAWWYAETMFGVTPPIKQLETRKAISEGRVRYLLAIWFGEVLSGNKLPKEKRRKRSPAERAQMSQTQATLARGAIFGRQLAGLEHDPQGYKQGCRCEICKTTYSIYQRGNKERQRVIKAFAYTLAGIGE